MGGLNRWSEEALTTDQLVGLVTRLEGHPDNAMPGVLGGFCVGRCGETAADYEGLVRVEIPPELKFVVVSPLIEVPTKESRGILPDQISHLDAVRSVNSAAYLTAAMISGDWQKLRNAASDFLHEPYRMPGIKGAKESIAAGVEAGGLTGWLSGSGSSVLTVAETNSAEKVSVAMRVAFEECGVESEVRILVADNQGMVIESD